MEYGYPLSYRNDYFLIRGKNMYLDGFSKAMAFLLLIALISGGLIGAGIYWLIQLFL